MKRGLYPLSALFLFGAVSHFLIPASYIRAVPHGFPRPDRLVAISGICELLGALGLLIPRTRRAAAVGLGALLVAVFPANVAMAVHPAEWPQIPAWALWARLPLQLPLIWWTLLYTRASHSNRRQPAE